MNETEELKLFRFVSCKVELPQPSPKCHVLLLVAEGLREHYYETLLLVDGTKYVVKFVGLEI